MVLVLPVFNGLLNDARAIVNEGGRVRHLGGVSYLIRRTNSSKRTTNSKKRLLRRRNEGVSGDVENSGSYRSNIAVDVVAVAVVCVVVLLELASEVFPM